MVDEPKPAASASSDAHEISALRERRELIRRLAMAAAVPAVVAVVAGLARQVHAGSGP